MMTSLPTPMGRSHNSSLGFHPHMTLMPSQSSLRLRAEAVPVPGEHGEWNRHVLPALAAVADEKLEHHHGDVATSGWAMELATVPHMSLMASRRGSSRKPAQKHPSRRVGAVALSAEQRQRNASVVAQGATGGRPAQPRQPRTPESIPESTPGGSAPDLEEHERATHAVEHVLEALEQSLTQPDSRVTAVAAAAQSLRLVIERRARQVEATPTSADATSAQVAHWQIRRLRMQLSQRDRELAALKLSVMEMRHRIGAQEKATAQDRKHELRMLHEARRGEAEQQQDIEQKAALLAAKARAAQLEAEVAADIEHDAELEQINRDERHALTCELEKMRAEKEAWQQQLDWSNSAHKAAEARAHRLSTQLRSYEQRTEAHVVAEEEGLVAQMDHVAKANAAGEHALHTLATGRAAGAERQWKAQLAINRTEAKAEAAAAEARALRNELAAVEAARRQAEHERAEAQEQAAAAQRAAESAEEEGHDALLSARGELAIAGEKLAKDREALAADRIRMLTIQSELRAKERAEADAKERLRRMEEECNRHIMAEQEAEAQATAALERAEEIMHAGESERAQMNASHTLLSAQLEQQARALGAAAEEQRSRLAKIAEFEAWQAEDAVRDAAELVHERALEQQLAEMVRFH